jgi:CheY-like chemotaxis protein
LTHIITNAIDAMEGTGTLTVRTRMEADTTVIEVSDTGPGMDPETRRRCLEPFYSTKGHGHSGMGLAITQGAIARCQGTLIIESLPGKGTTVILRMPIMSGTKAAAPVTPLPSLDHKLRILVIDDEACIRNLLLRALKANGYEVEIAADGPAAIEIFRSGLFNLVIVDLAMPIMNGNEVAAAIKQIRPRTPVIMLTGFGDVLTERGEKPAGVDFLMSKPMTLDDLQDAITRVIV